VAAGDIVKEEVTAAPAEAVAETDKPAGAAGSAAGAVCSVAAAEIKEEVKEEPRYETISVVLPIKSTALPALPSHDVITPNGDRMAGAYYTQTRLNLRNLPPPRTATGHWHHHAAHQPLYRVPRFVLLACLRL